MNTATWCLALLLAGAPAVAAPPAPAPARTPLSEIPDAELGDMRGRYVVGNDLVAWFGVTMTSVWQTASGQTLQGTLQLGMDFSAGGTPTLSFEPTVSITAADAPLPVATAVSSANPGRAAKVSAVCAQQVVSARKTRSGSAATRNSADSCG